MFRNESESVCLGLGSNLGDSYGTIVKAFLKISSLPEVFQPNLSRLYRTTPVSDIPQTDYINAVCRFQTSLHPEEIFQYLKKNETDLGKCPKPKNAPREIDIDILFFGPHYIHTSALQIPHPRWKERLFVLAPLADLIEEAVYPIDNGGSLETLKIKEFLHVFPNVHHECVFPLN